MPEVSVGDAFVLGVSFEYDESGNVIAAEATEAYEITVDGASFTASTSSDVWPELSAREKAAWETMLAIILPLI